MVLQMAKHALRHLSLLLLLTLPGFLALCLFGSTGLEWFIVIAALALCGWTVWEWSQKRTANSKDQDPH